MDRTQMRARIKQLLQDKLPDEAKPYYCHCCAHKVPKFMSWNEIYQNVICPLCNSHPRHRALAIYLEKNSEFNCKNLKLLHFAPHLSALRDKLSAMDNIEYITADLNYPEVDIKIDVTDIPYADNTFDIIFCSHVLEHVTDDLTAIKELYRVLKPGGWAYLAVPIDKTREITLEDSKIVSPEDRLKHFWQEDHVRLYGLDYKNKLERAGFTVNAREPYQNLTSHQLEQYGLQHREIYHLCMKENIAQIN